MPICPAPPLRLRCGRKERARRRTIPFEETHAWEELTHLQTKQLTTGLAVLVGLLLLVVAVLYFTQPPGALPGFLPGHEAGVTTRHTKHGILALALAACCFVAARFFWGPATDTNA